MKKITLLAAGLFLNLLGFAQIPNPGFETWYTETESPTHYLVPQHWISTDQFNNYLNNAYTGTSLTQTASSHSGNFAAQMQVVASGGDTIAGALFSCDSASQIIAYSFAGKMAGFPCTIRPQSLQGYYKFSGTGGDSALFLVYLTKWNGASRDIIAYGRLESNATVGSYTMVNDILTYYINTEYPDTALIACGIQGFKGKTAHIGSTMSLDDLAFNGSVPVGVDNLANSSGNVVLYPNPFNNNATLSIPQSVKLNSASLEIYNVL